MLDELHTLQETKFLENKSISSPTPAQIQYFFKELKNAYFNLSDWSRS